MLDFELHEISEPIVYAGRLAAFAEVYKTFYAGARSYSLDPAEQFDLFDFPRFDLTVAGFHEPFQGRNAKPSRIIAE
jgi:hypothetical protein